MSRNIYTVHLERLKNGIFESTIPMVLLKIPVSFMRDFTLYTITWQKDEKNVLLL